jgi:HD-like signal output (HDOD) protein
MSNPIRTILIEFADSINQHPDFNWEKHSVPEAEAKLIQWFMDEVIGKDTGRKQFKNEWDALQATIEDELRQQMRDKLRGSE